LFGLATGCTVDVQLADQAHLAVWSPEPPPEVDEER
jgi:hypothetical protein